MQAPNLPARACLPSPIACRPQVAAKAGEIKTKAQEEAEKIRQAQDLVLE